MPRWSPFEPYFWSLVKREAGDDACWLWMGGTDGTGYGRVCKDGKRQPAHRVAYELIICQIEPGLQACHRCDVKRCVRPSHIFIGTQVDNMQDWTKKGKNRLANDRSLWANGRHWENNPKAKKALADLRRAELQSGQRVVIRGEKGRIMGHRKVKKCAAS